MKKNKLINWLLILLGVLIVIAVVITLYWVVDNSVMSEKEAFQIAINSDSCIYRNGTRISSEGVYNPNSKTWWFSLYIPEADEGCSPACVVYQELKQGKINWRCTGLIS